MRNASELITADETNYIVSVPEGECIVASVVKNDILFIATDKHLYFLVDEKRLKLAKEF